MRNYLDSTFQAGTRSASDAGSATSNVFAKAPDEVLSNRAPVASTHIADQTRSSIEEAAKKYGAATHRVVTRRYAVK